MLKPGGAVRKKRKDCYMKMENKLKQMSGREGKEKKRKIMKIR